MAMTGHNEGRTLEARSAGAAERPMKNENLIELARFFQSNNTSPPLLSEPFPSSSPSPAVAQNTGVARDIFKAGHRRLRQFAWRQKKPSNSKAISDEAYGHLGSPQQEELPPVAKPKTSYSRVFEQTLSHSRSLDTMFTNSKFEVENIGRPWLDGVSEETSSEEKKRHRLSPLDLDEFSSIIKVAESFPDPDEETPPPYQQSVQSSDPSVFSDPPAITEGTYDSIEEGHQHCPNKTIGDEPRNENSNGAAILQHTTERQHGDSISGGTEHSSSKMHSTTNTKASSSSTSKSTHNLPPLKFFPDVLPPRTSSKGALRTPVSSQQHSVASSISSEGRKRSPSDGDTINGSPVSLKKVLSHGDPTPSGQGSAPPPAWKLDDTPVVDSSNKDSNSDDKNRGHKFLPMEEINAFPLPARGPADGRKGRNESPSSRIPSTPPYLRQQSHLSSTSGRTTPSLGTSRPLSPRSAYFRAMTDPKGLNVDRQDGPSQSTAPAESPQTPMAGERKEERNHAPKTKDTSQRRLASNTGKLLDEESQRAASPALSQAESSTTQKRDRGLRLETGRRLQRIAASDPKSPPPSSPLPLDPPVRPRRDIRRYCSSPTNSMSMYIDRSDEFSSPDPCRSPRISRSCSTRSASISHDNTQSEQKPRDYAESPLPSSDEEGMGVAHSSRARAKTPRKSDPSTSRSAPHSKKQVHSDSIRPSSPKISITTMSPPQTPRSDYTYRSQDQAASMIHSLETRVTYLEQQNKMLQAALVAALDASGKQPPESLMSSLASFSSGYKTPPFTGRSDSSMTSYCSSMDESALGSKLGKLRSSKSSSRLDSWQAARDSSSLSSLRSSMARDEGVRTKELEHTLRELEYGWLPGVGEPQAVRA